MVLFKKNSLKTILLKEEDSLAFDPFNFGTFSIVARIAIKKIPFLKVVDISKI